MSTPLSVLVPLYNAGRYLPEAIGSIADQLIPGDEVLVQDGGSTDGSMEALAAAYPDVPWLRIVSEPDGGQSDALNKALDRARHDYFIWLNGDDVVYPGALAAVREALAAGPDLLSGRSTVFDADGRIVRTYTPRPITREACVGRGSDIFTGSLAFRTQLVRDIGGFDTSFQYGMDLDLIARLTERDLDIVYIPEVVGGLRWHDEAKGGSALWPVVRAAHRVRMGHARNTRERLVAVSATGAYFLGGVVQPVRHSRLYSRIRAVSLRRVPLPTE